MCGWVVTGAVVHSKRVQRHDLQPITAHIAYGQGAFKHFEA